MTTTFLEYRIPNPPFIAAATMLEGHALRVGTPHDGPALLMFCRRNKVGAAYNLGARAWTLWGQMETPHPLVDSLRQFGGEVPPAPIVWAWIGAVMGTAEETNRKDPL
jgi:hypothetical protein